MFSSMQQVRDANASTGQHWFSPDTMRFFHSRVETELIAGRWFVTSEDGGPGQIMRRYTVREVADEYGRVSTVGEFMAHASKSDALIAVAELAHP